MSAAERIALSKGIPRESQIKIAKNMKEKGYTNSTIALQLGIPERSVRALLLTETKD